MTARRIGHLFRQRRLAHDESGATLVEFAFVAPVLVLMLMFMFDTGYFFYARSILSGEVQTVGRRSALETSTATTRATLDANLEAAVLRFVSNGQIAFTRKAYKSYGRAQSVAEAFTDGNSDNICNNNEAFDDANNNGTRDLDSGATGQGGARDVTILTATLTYDRIFPLAYFLGLSNQMSVSSSTILRNQPFDRQVQPTIGHCP